MAIPNELKQAAGYLLTHAHGMRAVLVMAELVKGAEDIERLYHEENARLDGAKAELVKVQEAIKAEGEELKDQRHKTAEARRNAAGILQDARDKSEAIIATAREDAEAAAREQHAAISLRLTANRSEVAALEAEIERLTNIERAAVLSVESLAFEATALEHRIEKAKTYLAKLAQG